MNRLSLLTTHFIPLIVKWFSCKFLEPTLSKAQIALADSSTTPWMWTHTYKGVATTIFACHQWYMYSYSSIFQSLLLRASKPNLLHASGLRQPWLSSPCSPDHPRSKHRIPPCDSRSHLPRTGRTLPRASTEANRTCRSMPSRCSCR